MTSKVYGVSLSTNAQPNAAKLKKFHLVVDLDNDPKSTAKGTQDSLNANHWDILQFPISIQQSSSSDTEDKQKRRQKNLHRETKSCSINLAKFFKHLSTSMSSRL